MKILVAEDDPTSALVLRKSLEKLGHEPVVVGDGEAAWNTVCRDEACELRLLICDWMMPGLDGLEVTRRIRAERIKGEPYRYILLLTGRGKAEDRQNGLAAGADDFMVKPLDMGDLIARLEVAQRIMALQENVQARGAQFEKMQMRLEAAAPLGELLIAQGSLTPSHLRQALDGQAGTGKRLGDLLVERGWVTEEDVTRARATQADVPFINVAEETPDPLLVAQVPEEAARKHHLLVLSAFTSATGADSVRVAVTNPWNIEGIDLVQSLTRRRVEPMLAADAALQGAINRAYRDIGADRLAQSLLGAAKGPNASKEEDIRTRVTADFDTSEDAPGENDDYGPVNRLLNTVLTEAIRRRASDIHIEPYKNDFEIRYRVDGELYVVHTLPRRFLANLLGRVKVMAELDIAERRLPQDGRIALRVDGRGIDLRVSTLPNQFGERAVLRVLDRANADRSLEDLGFSAQNRKTWDTLIRRPHGIILVTGPTGSGKTTTLYASLNALKSSTVNIMTCEDPIEYELDRVSQSAVNEKAGLTFARQLRAILRQDPDVVLVGEIRDRETAETAFRAALTGHLVLSTLHCNEAAGAPARLLDMGVPSFLIASALIGVVAQRLVRRLCPECHEPYPLTPADHTVIAGMGFDRNFSAPNLYRPGKCRTCDNVGFKGRLPVHEILVFDEAIRQITMKEGETAVLRAAAIAGGMITMACDGLEKAAHGLTTLDEVHRRAGHGG